MVMIDPSGESAKLFYHHLNFLNQQVPGLGTSVYQQLEYVYNSALDLSPIGDASVLLKGETMTGETVGVGGRILVGLGAFSPLDEVVPNKAAAKVGDDIVGGVGKTLKRLNNQSLKQISQTYNWGKYRTLDDHARRHGPGLGIFTQEGYAKAAQDFRSTALQGSNQSIESFTDSKGVLRSYDYSTNTFGSYNSNGTTRTYFSPDRGSNYWDGEIKKHRKN